MISDIKQTVKVMVYFTRSFYKAVMVNRLKSRQNYNTTEIYVV